MARSFASASSQNLSSSVLLTPMPMTMSCWFNPSVITGTGASTLMAISANDAVGGGFLLDFVRQGSDATRPIRAATWTGNGGNFVASSLAGPTAAGSWAHAAGVWASSANRVAYFNGTAGTANTATRSPSGPNRTTIGAVYFASASLVNYMDGVIAEAGIWSAALNANEIAALARGVSPLTLRPESLVAYWPLWGIHDPEIDLHPRSADATSRPLTLVNAPTQANHAPVVPYSRRLWGTVPEIGTGAPPAGNRRRRVLLCGAR